MYEVTWYQLGFITMAGILLGAFITWLGSKL